MTDPANPPARLHPVQAKRVRPLGEEFIFDVDYTAILAELGMPFSYAAHINWSVETEGDTHVLRGRVKAAAVEPSA